jgi:NADH:ubiquinone oxidoreductase subunit 6 (subunit J)
MTAENESVFTRRVAAAARAAWWTWLIGLVIVIVQSAGYLAFVHVGCVREQLGGLMGVGADEFQDFLLAFMLIIRLLLVIGLMACIFLSLWARALRRAEAA